MFNKNDTGLGYSDFYDFFKTQLRKVTQGEMLEHEFLDRICETLLCYEESLRVYEKNHDNVFEEIIFQYNESVQEYSN